MAIFNLDRPVVFRCAGIMRSMLAKILPEKRAMEMMLENDAAAFKKITPDSTIILEELTAVMLKTAGKARKSKHLEKPRKIAVSALLYITSNRFIIGMSRTLAKSSHNFEIIRSGLDGLGGWAKSMNNPDTPADARITMRVGKKFQGLAKLYPGANAIIRTCPRVGKLIQVKDKDESLDKEPTSKYIINKIKRFGGRKKGTGMRFLSMARAD